MPFPKVIEKYGYPVISKEVAKRIYYMAAALPEGERCILYLIAARLLCAVGEKHVFAETAVTLDCGSHSFAAKGRAVLREGWKAVESAFRATLKSKPAKENGEDEKKALSRLRRESI